MSTGESQSRSAHQWVVEAIGITKVYGQQTVLQDVSLTLEESKIYGLLGRNGAGKTTLMRILTAQEFASRGDVRVYGRHPYENNEVLKHVCLVREAQKYPDTYTLADVLAVAADLFPYWDSDFADELVSDFGLPRGKAIRAYSRGMYSAVGIVIGLASRAPLTIFDEPYLGLDAAGRTSFYERLLEDYGKYPRTIVLSTHLIDEVSRLLEHVLILDRGRLLVDVDADTLRDRAKTVIGPADRVAAFTNDKDVIHTEMFGSVVASSALGHWDEKARMEAEQFGLRLVPLSLQELFVRITDVHQQERRLISS